MKSYSFTIIFKDQIGFFSQSKVVSDIRDLVLHNGFVLGKNVNKVKNIKVKGNKVKISVSLLSDKSEKELQDAVKDIKSALKKKKYNLINNNSKNKRFTKKINKSKNKVNKSTLKNKKIRNLFFFKYSFI